PWSAAGGIAAAFYPLHMIGNLRMGFARMAIYTAAVAAFRVLAAPLWGRVLDRGGARPVLFTSAFALSLSPLFWIFAMEGRLWPLAIDAAVSGAANAGLSLATFSLPLALSRPATRSFYAGALATACGLASGIYCDSVGVAARVARSRNPVLRRRLTVINRDGERHRKLRGREQRCVALEGVLGVEVSCAIYQLRPAGCRRVQPGSRECRRDR